jgi:hypothetical protein
MRHAGQRFFFNVRRVKIPSMPLSVSPKKTTNAKLNTLPMTNTNAPSGNENMQMKANKNAPM